MGQYPAAVYRSCSQTKLNSSSPRPGRGHDLDGPALPDDFATLTDSESTNPIRCPPISTNSYASDPARERLINHIGQRQSECITPTMKNRLPFVHEP
jgi:hypothetical protein